MCLEGIALVTGGRGLGEAICRIMAKECAHIAVCDINLVSAKRVANSIQEAGRKAVAIKADVSKRKEGLKPWLHVRSRL